MSIHQTIPIEASGSENPSHSGTRGAWRGWLEDRSLASKLRLAILANVMVPLLLAAGLVACIAYLGQEGTTKAKTATAQIRMGHAALALVETERAAQRFMLQPSAGNLDALNREAKVAEEQITQANSYSADEMHSDIKPALITYQTRIEGVVARIEALDAGSGRANVEAIRSDVLRLEQDIDDYSRDLHTVTERKGRELIEKVGFSITTSVSVAIVCALLTLLLARIIIRNASGTVMQIATAMDRLAKGEISAVIPGEERGDELGAIARALAVFRRDSQTLSELNRKRIEEAEEQISRQKTHSEQMRKMRAEKRNLLEELATGFEVSVGELITAVSAASEQLKATSQTMGDLAEGSEDQAKSAADAMANASANVTAAAAATDEFALSIAEISRQASSSTALANDATQLVTTASTRMNDLSQAADEIGEIAGLIQTIAQRTNLLALNASIEAARGGEAGRGFAVVASEVKELAMQTSNATSSVADRIAAMQATTKSSAADLMSIVKQIGEVEQAAVMIASAVDQQSVSGGELARNIDVVAAGTGTVEERLAALLRVSEDTGTAADDVVESANALGAHADDLRAKASRFIEDVRRSARELEAGDRREQSA